MKTKTTRVRLVLTLGLILATALGVASGVAYAAGGDLDPSFSGDGKVTTDFAGGPEPGDTANDITIQPDGKIVVVGSALVNGYYDFAIARYLPNGDLDPVFGGGDGKVTLNFFLTTGDSAEAVAIQPDGKVVVAGVSGAAELRDNFALARLNGDGSLDSGFGNSGWVTTDFNGDSYDFLTDMTIQPDGRIVVAGYAYMGETSWDFALARYTPNGTLDASFSGDGKVTTDFDGGVEQARSDRAHAVAIQPDGKIVAVGSAYSTVTGSRDFAMARYNTDGSPDATFGYLGSGRDTIDFFGGFDEAYDVALQPDGKIVAAGSVDVSVAGHNFGWIRVVANGQLDTSFDIDGRQTADFGSGGNDEAYALAIQADGKIVAAGGFERTGGVQDFTLARLDAIGNLDGTFGGGDGWLTTDFAGLDVAKSMAIQADGKLVVAGTAYGYAGGGDDDFASARYLSGLEPPPSTPTPTHTPTSTPTNTALPNATPSATPTCVPGTGGGLLVGSGVAIGYPPNNFGQLTRNIVNYTFANSQVRPNEYAIFQTHDPWGFARIKNFIITEGHTYTELHPSLLPGFNFSQYRVVILNWDEHYTFEFLNEYQAAIPALQSYVANGGVVWVQAAVQGGFGETFPMPFGGIGTLDTHSTNDVVANGNPMVVGVPDPFFGNYASYAEYSQLPPGFTTVVVSGIGSGMAGGADKGDNSAGGAQPDMPDVPTLYEYRPSEACPPTTATPTMTHTATATTTATLTSTNTPTNAPTNTPTSTNTSTNTPTNTPMSTGTATATSTPASTSTSTMTATPTCTIAANYAVTRTTGNTLIPASNLVPGSTCQNCTVNISLPFPYTFYGQTFTSANVSLKGNMQFASNVAGGNNVCLPATTHSYAIFPFWDDFSVNPAIGVYTQVTGTVPNRIFIVQWRNKSASGSSPKWEVLLYEGQQRFDFIYGSTPGSGNSATIGAQEGTGGGTFRRVQWSCNIASIQAGDRLSFNRSSCP